MSRGTASARQERRSPGEDLRFGYVDATATNTSLYGLYSGRARGELPGYAFYGTFVHEYDWEGRLRRVFKLDAYAIGIAVDPEGSTLYASRLYPTPAILRYRLPPERRGTRGERHTKRERRPAFAWRRPTARWSLLEGSFFRASGETTASGFWPDPRILDPAPLDPVRPACARRRGAAATSYVRPSNPSHRPGAARPAFSACASSPCGSPARLPGVPEMTVALHCGV
jgi:hypothetical protein